jgi:hypothetical protein
MIYVECKPDVYLVYVLIKRPSDEVEHCGGRSKVLEKLEHGKQDIGIVDEDPNALQDPRIKNFDKVDNFDFIKSKYLLALYEDRNKNKLIRICPQLEDWIFRISKEEKDINLKDLGFSDNLYRFRNEAKLNPGKFQQLLQQLIERKNEKLIFLRDFVLSKPLK